MPITHYTSSDGRVIALADMPWTYLRNAIRKLEANGGDPAMIAALKAESASRPSEGDPAPRSAPPRGDSSPDDVPGIGDNLPPEETADELRARLEADHRDLLLSCARAEMAVAGLPKADAIQTDADLEKIDDWVIKARRLKGRIESTREAVKKPVLLKSKLIDALFGGARDDLDNRIKAVEARKKPYLMAKAAREQAAQQAREEAARQAAAKLRAEEEVARQAAQQAAAEAAQREQELRDAEARAAQENAIMEALQDADEDPDLNPVVQAEIEADAKEQVYRGAIQEADHHAVAADNLGRAAALAEEAAEQAAAVAAAPTHLLAKAGASGLKAVQKHRITAPLTFIRSLGPLAPYLPEKEIEAALARAAKADPLPVIPGVEFYEDFEATTARSR